MKLEYVSLSTHVNQTIIMKVKIDTKEKFHVITLMEPILTANIAADLTQLVTKFLHEEIRNVVLNLKDVSTKLKNKAAEELAQMQQAFYEKNASFVICDLQLAGRENNSKKWNCLKIMNITPNRK